MCGQVCFKARTYLKVPLSLWSGRPAALAAFRGGHSRGYVEGYIGFGV